MKTRNDFVSNSSSCSFVITVGKSFPLNDFIKEACEGCLKHRDEDDPDRFANEQNEMNNAVLNYHLRASELLYLGSLCLGKRRSIYTREQNGEWFDALREDIARGNVSSEDTVVENTDDRIVIEFDDFADGMALPKYKTPHVTMDFHWNDSYSNDISKQKPAADAIAEFAKNYTDNGDYKSKQNSSTYFISRTTIWNTRALIAAGYKVVLEDWMDLDKLEKMLQDGDRIFGIMVSNGGDGVQEDALYTFGGWDGEDVFDGMSGISVIHSETM